MKEHNFSNQSYEDIIDLPHPVSKSHPQMSLWDRAAQFSPFAALTGYDGAIKETARRTDQRIELDDTEKAILDEKLSIIQEQIENQIKNKLTNQIKNQIEVEIDFFKKDKRKEGGLYCTVHGIVKKIDVYEKSIVMQNEIRIPIEDVVDITADFI